MMRSHDEWLQSIIRAATHIASREYQAEAWLPGGKHRSSPDEVYLTLIEDNVFDRFFATYRTTFTEQQEKCWKDLRQRLEEYYDKLPKNPDPRLVLDDPEWETVRQSAREFVHAFSGDGLRKAGHIHDR